MAKVRQVSVSQVLRMCRANLARVYWIPEAKDRKESVAIVGDILEDISDKEETGMWGRRVVLLLEDEDYRSMEQTPDIGKISLADRFTQLQFSPPTKDSREEDWELPVLASQHNGQPGFRTSQPSSRLFDCHHSPVRVPAKGGQC